MARRGGSTHLPLHGRVPKKMGTIESYGRG